MELVWSVIQGLGGLAVVVTLAGGAAYAFFRFFAENWLASKFDQRLQSLQHAHEGEIERLRFRINSMMDRATKLHQREYDALPELWGKLSSAWANVGAFISSLQQFPDVSRMSDDEMEEFLAETSLKETQKAKIRHSSDRTDAYRREIYWHQKHDAEESARKFSRYLMNNGIFVLPAIKDAAKRLEKLLWDALLEHEMNEEQKIIPRERTAKKTLKSEGEPILQEVETLIHDRLWTGQHLD